MVPAPPTRRWRPPTTQRHQRIAQKIILKNHNKSLNKERNPSIGWNGRRITLLVLTSSVSWKWLTTSIGCHFHQTKKKIITKIYSSGANHSFIRQTLFPSFRYRRIWRHEQNCQQPTKKKIFSKSVNDMAFWHQFQRFPSSRFCAQRRNARQQNAIKSASFPLHPPLPCHPFSFFFFFCFESARIHLAIDTETTWHTPPLF